MDTLNEIRRRAARLVAYAQAMGVVLTVEQVPLRPLAMGNHRTEIHLRPARHAPAVQHPDDAAVDAFAKVMKDKLAAARTKGRGGWQTCPPEELSRMLREHVEKGDPRDVANFCMFLWSMGHGIAPLLPASAAGAARYLHDGLISLLEKCRVGYVMSKGTRKKLVTATHIAEALAGSIAAPKPPAQQDAQRPPNCGSSHCSCIECPDSWAEAEAISNLPAVDEAIRNLLDDHTGDNATAVVLAVLSAAKQGGAGQ